MAHTKASIEGRQQDIVSWSPAAGQWLLCCQLYLRGHLQYTPFHTYDFHGPHLAAGAEPETSKLEGSGMGLPDFAGMAVTLPVLTALKAAFLAHTGMGSTGTESLKGAH